MDEIQFGARVAGRSYRDRKAAFGIVERDGLLAAVAITLVPGAPPVLDLPGGGVDPGESETEALVREFGEEAGLKISPGDLLVRAAQYHIKPDGDAVNNHAAFHAAVLLGPDDQLKIEDDHELVWMEAEDFIRRARHEAQAWAVCVWLRSRTSGLKRG